MRRAHAIGLRTYAMLCPLLPGVADDDSVDELIRSAVSWGAEEIFAETVNARGPGLRLTQEGLAAAGFTREAEAVGRIRNRAEWSRYAVNLVRSLQRATREFSSLSRLRILLYSSGLLPEDERTLRNDDAGIVWL